MNIAGLRAIIKFTERSAATNCARLLAIGVLVSGLSSGLPAAAEDLQPSDPAMSAEKAMVATANPHASAAALEMLKAGGSALDAAVAAQMVLGLVEPQSSGIGGGGFLLHYDGPGSALTSYDGRETAPAAADPSMFLQADGTPRGWLDVAKGGQPVGVPGVVAMLEAAHRAHGVLPWATLFEPAIRLAEAGFDVSPRLSRMITRNAELADYEVARAYFFRSDGTPCRWRVRSADRRNRPRYRAGGAAQCSKPRVTERAGPGPLPPVRTHARLQWLPAVDRLRHGAANIWRTDCPANSRHPVALRSGRA